MEKRDSWKWEKECKFPYTRVPPIEVYGKYRFLTSVGCAKRKVLSLFILTFLLDFVIPDYGKREIQLIFLARLKKFCRLYEYLIVSRLSSTPTEMFCSQLSLGKRDTWIREIYKYILLISVGWVKWKMKIYLIVFTLFSFISNFSYERGIPVNEKRDFIQSFFIDWMPNHFPLPIPCLWKGQIFDFCRLWEEEIEFDLCLIAITSSSWEVLVQF